MVVVDVRERTQVIDLAAPRSGEAEWIAPVREALRRSPEPEAAITLASELLGAAPRERVEELGRTRPESLARVLFACCGVAPFLSAFLRTRPEWLFELAEDQLERARSRKEQVSRLDAELARAGLEPGRAEKALRLFKYFELARLTIRDCCEECVPLKRSGETLAQVSQLADLLLDRALQLVAARLAARWGAPRWQSEQGGEIELGFAVLGLGKLGSEELNYSSDVDLVYVFESPPGPLGAGPGERSPEQYFTRLAQNFGEVVNASSAAGFLYRVDLDLRPEGSQGSLVVSEKALAEYYEVSADTWEKAAFMKARPVAGDRELGWRAIRAVNPVIYSTAMDYAAVDRIKALKEKVEQSRGRAEAGFNLKLDSGGIRDVEFLAQAMQLLHGGRVPQVRNRSTEGALESLAEVGLLAEEQVEGLLESYLFLRRVENRLQMVGERQTHRVPAEPGARRRLARAMGFLEEDALRAFDAALQRHRDRILELFQAFLLEGGRERIFEIFARNAPQLSAFPTTRAMLERLAEHFARAIELSADPERALNNLDRFIQGIGSRRFYFELLLDRPELVPRLAALFAASKFLSDIFARHPRLIEPVFENPDRLLLTREELRQDMEQIRREVGGDAEDMEAQLETLRLFHHRQVANVGLLDIAEKITRGEVERSLAEIAEVCLESTLEFSRRTLEGASSPSVPGVRDASFLVVAMGKLGIRELAYGSDLDLIFLYDASQAEVDATGEIQAHFVRLCQRLISVIATPTAEGLCYEIDARMRPSGHQGTLVTSLDSFRRYHDRHAQVWERQALLRARPVAGDESLAADFRQLRLEILSRPAPQNLAAEIHRIRQRMENELARETRVRRDFKTGRGGVLDVESVVQYLRLLHGAGHPELLEVGSKVEQIERLGRLGLLDGDSLRVLSDGWEFLQRLGSRLRIVENRSISDLDEQRSDLDGLARRLGYQAGGREAAPRRALLLDYHHHTEAIRGVYDRVLGSS
jgi:glutamate-ammonia-ligase adenylyltransferase